MTDKAGNEPRVRKLVVEHLGVPDDFDMDASLADLGADSLDTIELALKMEDEFDKPFDDDSVDTWRTPRDMLTAANA